MVSIRYAQESDKNFWFALDRHISESEFLKKASDKTAYILFENENPIGILRYNLFWDNTPFCTLLFLKKEHRKKGFGKQLLTFWEQEMRLRGYKETLTSTRSDESAQHFYRKAGYKDCGCLLLEGQPAEIFMTKTL